MAAPTVQQALEQSHSSLTMSEDIEMTDASLKTLMLTVPASETPVRELQNLTLEPTDLRSKMDVRPEPIMEEGLPGVSPERFAKLAHWFSLKSLKKASPFLYSSGQIKLRHLQDVRMQYAKKRKLLGSRQRHYTLLDLKFAGQGNLHDKKQAQRALQKQIHRIWNP